MTEAAGDTPSVVERTRPVEAGAAVVAIHFFGDIPVFALSEEALLFAPKDGERRVAVHGGAILSVASDSAHIVTGGDDGTVAATGVSGDTSVIAKDAKRRWIDHVAIGPDGATAWSAGKQAFVKTGKGDERAHEAPSSVAGLAFAPKGFRLAIAHYNGASLWFPNAAAKPEVLEWKGSHVAVTFSPDGRFLITAMQEPTLHGWRLADAKNMRMSGYSSKVRSLSWAAAGKWLATSGSTQLILWPFQGKDGPMGKQPELLAPRDQRVVTVACHPTQEIVAVGYDDGMIVLVRINDGAEILAKKPGAGPVSALAWNASGTLMAFGTENGGAGVIDLA